MNSKRTFHDLSLNLSYGHSNRERSAATKPDYFACDEFVKDLKLFSLKLI